MNVDEFLNQEQNVELDVQKAVVESLAADKAAQDEHIAELKTEKKELEASSDKLKCDIAELKAQVTALKEELARMGDTLAKNVEGTASNSIALLDRSSELSDRFDGETRDHVLEVIREAREAAEKDGRLRRAQVLEGILVANESSGELEKRRQDLKKLFTENQNLVNGQVINELDKLEITYKVGEKYLLVDEIIKRAY